MSKKFTLTPQQYQAVADYFNATSSLVKVTVGIGNNAAWAACLDAYDRIRQHPGIDRRMKGSTTPRRQFKRVFKMLHDYERALIFPTNERFFHVADMPPKTRNLFGDITDRQYYDFWAAFGFTAYQQTRPFFTSLVNKYRLININHHVANPEIMAWATAATSALDIAVDIWQKSIDYAYDMGRGLYDSGFLEKTFASFSLRAIADRWAAAVDDLQFSQYQPTDTELRNVQAGFDQLGDMWMDEESLFGSRIKTAEDYAEIFRTNGTMKKTMREFAEMRDEVREARL